MKSQYSRFFSEYKYLLLISVFSFLLPYASSFVSGYGYFIDEFYYIACASRPAFGYVDHPPLAVLILTVFKFFFGTSLLAIRFLPDLAQAASVFMAGIIAKELSGQRFSQCLAACSMAASPMVMAFAGFYSMNAFEPLLAIALVLLAIRMIKGNNPRLWIWAGIVMGLGMLNKHTFAVFILAFVFSLLIAGKWRLIVNKWFFLAGICALMVFLPNLIWQIINDYPSLEFYRNISRDKNVYTPPVPFIIGQITGMSPSVVPVWLAGAIYLLVSKRIRQFRFLSVLFISLFLFMMLSGTSRSDRMIFAYPAVLAGGALFFESIIMKYNLRWLKGVLLIFVFSGLFLSLPLILPYFNYGYVASYVKRLGINTEMERGKKPPLPQLLADRIGWEEKFSLVLGAYNSLTDEEKRQVILAGGNYGQAGVIELFGKDYNLPFTGTSHNSYYLWSKSYLLNAPMKPTILLQLDNREAGRVYKQLFASVEEFHGEFSNDYVSSHENHLVVFICRGPKISFDEMLDRSKNYH